MNLNKDFICSPFTVLPEGLSSDHDPCGRLDDFSYRAIGEPFQGASLPPSSQLPVSATLDTSLQERVENALLGFLREHKMVESVFYEACALLMIIGKARLFCTNSPQCTVSVHDLRTRLLDPLVMFLLQEYQAQLGEDVNKLNGGRYILHSSPEDPDQTHIPHGITFALRHTHTTVASNTIISFEEGSSFMTFGCQTNLFAREDECKYFLHQRGPIPLDPSGRSHGAQAMLNKLAWRMQSAIQRDPKTGKVELPVRFGIMMSTHFAILAESVTNPNNDQEVGLIYTPIFKIGTTLMDRDRFPFHFWRNPFRFCSSPLYWTTLSMCHFRPTSPSNLYLVRGEIPMVPAVIPVAVGKLDMPRKGPRNNQVEDWRTRDPRNRSPLTSWQEWNNLGIRLEAVMFDVVGKPGKTLAAPRHRTSHRLIPLSPALLAYLSKPLGEQRGRKKSSVTLSNLREIKVDTLPLLAAVQLLGRGGFGSVTAGKLVLNPPGFKDPVLKDEEGSKAPEVDRLQAGTPREGIADCPSSSSIPTDRPVAIKLFEDDKLEAGIRKSLFYEHIFPLLPKNARAFLPAYYGTFRSARGNSIALIIGYGGRPIRRSERSNEELQQKVDNAYCLFDKHGVDHSDRNLRNVLLREDGSLCLID
ncbi:BZ3500_MvSof-1268-A1-R1_Chr9g10730 [Microbotryum saponariae]|uniref:BZ3500_MvSof-1268-A1-R1_Chr9g10730 protein n=1 Tax=Microbotryum saponariae TaxID=289078 RepID=A0A2X0N712_9BASI|nr:BZ3501_MvSof-1269-A2-R1_Chr9g10478 [Microbotryum saponariae]SDA00597.1 BZ3500_MvSof-1268-A1-R1_Chr9g10730 [Microbotryum saponariae]